MVLMNLYHRPAHVLRSRAVYLQNVASMSPAGAQQQTQIVMATPELASRLKDVVPAQLGLPTAGMIDVAAKLKVKFIILFYFISMA